MVKALKKSKESFLANCESSISSIRGLKVILANCEFEGSPCVSVFSWYVQSTLLLTGDMTRCSAKSLSRHVCSIWQLREKRHPLSRGMSRSLRKRVSFWHQEAPLFRRVQIALPVRGLLEDCYSYLFILFRGWFFFSCYCLGFFVCLFCFFFFISVLIPTLLAWLDHKSNQISLWFIISSRPKNRAVSNHVTRHLTRFLQSEGTTDRSCGRFLDPLVFIVSFHNTIS